MLQLIDRVINRFIIAQHGYEKLLELPDVRQTYNYDCGVKAVQGVLAYYGIDIREDHLADMLGTTEEGTSPEKIIKVLSDQGFDVEDGEMTISELKRYIDNKYPVIVVLQAWADDPKNVDWEQDWDDGHYVICAGYDGKRLIFEDPSIWQKVFLTEDEFMKRWHDISSAGNKFVHYGIAAKGTPAYHEFELKHMDSEGD